MENTNNDIRMSINEGYLRLTEPTPFSITFTWKDERRTVQLENGEDVLKLADILSKVLTENNIEHKIIK